MFCQTLDKKFPRSRVPFLILNDFLSYALPVLFFVLVLVLVLVKVLVF